MMLQYITQKQKVLKHFGIYLTSKQLLHLKSLKTEIAVDNFARTLILHKLYNQGA